MRRAASTKAEKVMGSSVPCETATKMSNKLDCSTQCHVQSHQGVSYTTSFRGVLQACSGVWPRLKHTCVHMRGRILKSLPKAMKRSYSSVARVCSSA